MATRPPPRAVLIQLPVPHPSPADARANVPLAPAWLAAASAARGYPTVLPPPALQDHGGDAVLLDWMESAEPDVVGFTTYLWNIERTRRLAAMWKAGHPRSEVVLGGPEMTAADAGGAEVVVVGEGEEAWPHLLSLVAEGAVLPRTRGPSAPADPSIRPDPYATGILRPVAGGSVYLETVRGCTRRCDYCYYSKAARGLRPFRRDRIGTVLAIARECGARDVYLMDPCFNAAPDYLDKLAEIARVNTTRIPLHAEIELESVTPAAADAYARAGVVSVEVGLQSTNRAALRAVHRGFSRTAFLRGAHHLAARGIEVRTGLILGLPGDDPAGFRETIRFVADAGLANGTEVYPLSVLPGTGLRERAATLGLVSMPRPPYWVLSNGAMGAGEMVEALEEAQVSLDLDLFPTPLPHFRNPAPGIVGYLDLREPGAADAALAKRGHGRLPVATSLTILASGPLPSPDLTRIAGAVRASSPDTMTQVVVVSPTPPPWLPWATVADAFRAPDHYHDREHIYHPDAQGLFSVRLFHLVEDPAVALSYYRPGAGEEQRFDPVVRYVPGMDTHPLLDHLPPLLARTPRDYTPRARQRYRGHEPLLLDMGA